MKQTFDLTLQLERVELETLLLLTADSARRMRELQAAYEVKKELELVEDFKTAKAVVEKIHNQLLDAAGYSIFDCPGKEYQDGCPICGRLLH